MAQTVFLAHVVPGMESLLEEEIRDIGGHITRVLSHFDERTSLVIFTYSDSPHVLLDLRISEDIFVLGIQNDAVPAHRSALATIRGACATSKGLDTAASVALQARPRRRGKVSFRVIARKGGEHAFRRVDVQRAVELGIGEHFPAWRLVEDDAQLEVWVQLVGQLLLVAIRISSNAMRQRTWRAASLPAALKPTIAYGMVKLSRPKDDDVFLDPMCGSGTILIERAHAGRYRLLLGGDLAPAAVEATRENIGPRYKPVEIQQWDARALPLEDDSVSVIVTNLPFGKQIGTPAEIRELYPALLKEWMRILAPGGRMVLLTSERMVLQRTVAQRPELQLTRQLRLLVRGQEATAYVIHPS